MKYDFNEIYADYESGLTKKQLCKKFKISNKTINKLFKVNNKSLRNPGYNSGSYHHKDKRKADLYYKLEENYQYIVDQYANGKTSVELAKEFYCKPTYIIAFLHRKNIVLNGPNEIRQKELKEKLELNKEKIIDLYVNQQKRIQDIEKQFNLSRGVVRRFLKEHNILRTRAQSRKIYRGGFLNFFDKMTKEEKQEYFWKNICVNNPNSQANKTFLILKELFPNVIIEPEKIFIVDGKRMRGDFYFEWNEEKFLVEYNGIQHYKPVKFPGMDDEAAKAKFEYQTNRDERLRSYCAEQGILLIEIDCRIARKSGLRETILDQFK